MSLVLPSTQLVSELTEMGFRRVVGIRDRLVLCPSIGWIKKFAEGLAVPPSQEESNDCDDYAWNCVAEANKFRRKNKVAEASGHAVLYCTLANVLGSLLNGVDSSGSLHATNIIRSPDGWVLLEAQTRRLSFYSDVRADLALLDLVIV